MLDLGLQNCPQTTPRLAPTSKERVGSCRTSLRFILHVSTGGTSPRVRRRARPASDTSSRGCCLWKGKAAYAGELFHGVCDRCTLQTRILSCIFSRYEMPAAGAELSELGPRPFENCARECTSRRRCVLRRFSERCRDWGCALFTRTRRRLRAGPP